MQGERDTLFPLSQADANARAIAANGTTVAVTWYNGGHDGGSPDTATEARITGWFQHYLAGAGPVPSNAFRYTVDGPISDTGSARSRTLEAPAYPGLADGHQHQPGTDPDDRRPAVRGEPAGRVTGLHLQPARALRPGLDGAVDVRRRAARARRHGSTPQPFDELTVITGTPRITVTVSKVPIRRTSWNRRRRQRRPRTTARCSTARSPRCPRAAPGPSPVVRWRRSG